MLQLERWSRLWRRLGADLRDAALYEQLIAAYATPTRFYHNEQHLSECLHHFDSAAHLMPRRHEVELALYFHDAVYDARRADNEARSAAWAQQAIAKARLPDMLGAYVATLILLTDHSAPPVDEESALLLDIDLAILGAEPVRFAQYCAQIRQEYAWVPWPIYRQKRAAVLRHFLDRPSIYYSKHFREQFEGRARSNLANALQYLDEN